MPLAATDNHITLPRPPLPALHVVCLPSTPPAPHRARARAHLGRRLWQRLLWLPGPGLRHQLLLVAQHQLVRRALHLHAQLVLPPNKQLRQAGRQAAKAGGGACVCESVRGRGVGGRVWSFLCTCASPAEVTVARAAGKRCGVLLHPVATPCPTPAGAPVLGPPPPPHTHTPATPPPEQPFVRPLNRAPPLVCTKWHVPHAAIVAKRGGEARYTAPKPTPRPPAAPRPHLPTHTHAGPHARTHAPRPTPYAHGTHTWNVSMGTSRRVSSMPADFFTALMVSCRWWLVCGPRSGGGRAGHCSRCYRHDILYHAAHTGQPCAAHAETSACRVGTRACQA